MRSFFLSVLLVTLLALPASAQEQIWVQIEAKKSLTLAQERARAYGSDLENVAGFYVGGGWYAIAIGPFASRASAQASLSELRRRGQIPRDSFIADGGRYRNQYWPGADEDAAEDTPDGDAAPEPTDASEASADSETTAADAASDQGDTPDAAPAAEPEADTSEAAEPEAAEPEAAEPATAPEPAPEPEFRDPGETVTEARASEAALSRDDKRALQVALQWAGFYNSTIDGLFGPGTRKSMAAWQAANGYEETGVLSTRQRQEAIDAYNAILDGLNLQVVQDDAAGIRMMIPAGVVAFSRYSPPFVTFDASGDLAARVLLISQAGDEATLAGLYEVMTTLEIVPEEGERRRKSDSFVLTGQDETLHSYTEARLENGEIKGFTLIWPAGDEKRRTRVLDEMRASFERIDGVLDPEIVTPSEEQSVDLVSGLQIRRPERTGTGFFIDDDGTVLTALDIVDSCGEITLNGGTEATLAFSDATSGLAVLRPNEALAPLAHALFQTGVPRLKNQVALAGFPYGGILTTAATNFGTLEDLRGLDGDDTLLRLELTTSETELGGPIFDNTGHVLGMLVAPNLDANRVLPKNVAFARDAQTIIDSLEAGGISVRSGDGLAFAGPESVTDLSSKIAILVSCWK